MLKRIISALIALPLLFFVVFKGGNVLFIAVLIVSIIGLREFYKAMEHKSFSPVKVVGYLSTIALINIFYFFDQFQYVPLLFFLLLLVLNVIQLSLKKYNIIDAMLTLFGVVYIPLMLGHVLLVDKADNNIIIWLIFITAWGTDTFAYFTGYFLGKTKLCPSVSPKKTVEGAIGGILGSLISSTVFGYFFLKEYLLIIMILGVVTSIISQIGDLAASMIKRYAGIKDFGYIMPGHGGILDRMDSLLFTAPTIFYFLTILINKN